MPQRLVPIASFLSLHFGVVESGSGANYSSIRWPIRSYFRVHGPFGPTRLSLLGMTPVDVNSPAMLANREAGISVFFARLNRLCVSQYQGVEVLLSDVYTGRVNGVGIWPF
jgi:hypothetical protein